MCYSIIYFTLSSKKVTELQWELGRDIVIFVLISPSVSDCTVVVFCGTIHNISLKERIRQLLDWVPRSTQGSYLFVIPKLICIGGIQRAEFVNESI